MKRRKHISVNSVTVLQLMLLAAVLCFSAIIFMYIDITNTIDNSNILLRAIRQGKILEFYDLSVEQSVTNFSANYNFPVYVLFAIWQAPAYLAAHLLHRDYMEWAWTLMWSKLLVILFAAAVAFWIYKIVLLCTANKRRAYPAVFFYFSSMTVFYPVFICGQLDTISVSLMLMGVYFYLKGNQKLFWLSFFIAAPFKMFALLLSLPLLLIREKNVGKVLGLWISMAGLLILEKFIFRNSPTYRYALAAQSRDAINGLLGANINIGRAITVFLLCYIGLLLFAYIKKSYTQRLIIYMCFFLWGTFGAFSFMNTYWIFLVGPFMVMSIFVNDRFLKATTISELVGSFSYFLFITAYGTYVFQDERLVNRLFLPRMMSIPAADQLKYGNLVNLFVRKDWSQYTALFSTMYVAAILAVLVLTLPSLQNDDGPNEEAETWALIVRPIFLALAATLILYSYTAKTNPVAFDTRGIESSGNPVNLTQVGQMNRVAQTLAFTEERDLDELILKFDNAHATRSNMGLLVIDLWDLDTDVSRFHAVIGCSSITSSSDVYVDLRSTHVTAGTQYEIRLSGKAGNRWYFDRERLHPYITSRVSEDLKPATINGEQADGNLYFEIR